MIIIKTKDELDHILDKNDLYSNYNDLLINNYYLLVDLYNKFSDSNIEYNVIFDEENRVELLRVVSDVILNNDNLGDDIKEVVCRLIINLSDYELGEHRLESIDVSAGLKEKMKTKYCPSKEEMEILTKIVKRNANNYDTKISKMIFSEIFDDGLHKNITEDLVVKRENVPHLLSLTSNGNSFYQYYRKTKLFSMINNLKNNTKDEEEFRRIFKEQFGRDYNSTNVEKIINCKYTPNPKEEEELSNENYGLFPKDAMLSFLSDDNNLNNIVEENEKINNYIKNYFNLEGSLNEFLTKNDITNNEEFMKDFRNVFLYDYPLINYNEMLMKNISFYNMYLFENINSIVVDYGNKKSSVKRNSDVYLLSYDISKTDYIDYVINKCLKEDMNVDDIYSYFKKDDIEYKYGNLLKSLDSFRKEDRHYFEDMDKITSKFRKAIIERRMKEENSNLKENIISCFGFVETNGDDLENNSNASLDPFKHEHRAETNLAVDYEEYLYDYSVNGNVLPIKILFDGSQDVDDKKPKKIIKMDRIIQSIEKTRGHDNTLIKLLFEIKKFNRNLKNNYSGFYYDSKDNNIDVLLDDLGTIRNFINGDKIRRR